MTIFKITDAGELPVANIYYLAGSLVSGKLRNNLPAKVTLKDGKNIDVYINTVAFVETEIPFSSYSLAIKKPEGFALSSLIDCILTANP